MKINRVVNKARYRATFRYLYTSKVKQINVNSKPEEQHSPAGDIPVLLKIGGNFLSASQIRSVQRFGRGCKIILSSEEELLVNINYDKVADFIGKI